MKSMPHPGTVSARQRSAARRLLLAAALLVVLVAAGLMSACGSGDSGSGAGASATASPSPSPSPTPGTSRGWLAGERRISGGEGVVLATTDGGATWETQVSGAAGQLKDVWFADEAHGWAVGSATTILATADGGAHWTAQKAPGGYNEWYGVTFTDALHGWVVGGAEQNAFGTILVTSDGGETWRTQWSKGNVLYAAAFIDETRGWVAGWGRILATADGGRHWRVQRVGVPQDGWFYDVTFADADHGWAVGEDGNLRGLVIATIDGGAHWTKQNPDAPGPLLSVSFADAEHGCAGGVDGVLLTTDDGGATWKRHRIRYEYPDGSGSYVLDEGFCSVSRSDALHITAVSGTGLVYVTTDGGATWTKRHGHTYRATINSAFFLTR
jgi:photosystem II stability/assembly factor-like uncharacterized protein